MGAACSVKLKEVVETTPGGKQEAMPSSRSIGLTPRSKDAIVSSVMAYVPFAVSQFYSAHPIEVLIF